jgi:hypothetical protein
MSTHRTIETWVERFNAGDVAAVIDGDWAALEWIDPDGLRGCGFFHVRGGLIVQQRGYWDSAQLNEIHPDVHPD